MQMMCVEKCDCRREIDGGMDREMDGGTIENVGEQREGGGGAT